MDERTTLLQLHFATLLGSKQHALQQLLTTAHIVKLPAGEPVFHAGDLCQNYLLMLKGSVCVYLTTNTGRDVVLYHVGPGESCVITTSCLLGGNDYPAAGVTDAPLTHDEVYDYSDDNTNRDSTYRSPPCFAFLLTH